MECCAEFIARYLVIVLNSGIICGPPSTSGTTVLLCYKLTRFGTMGTKSPGLGGEEQGGYHESAHLAKGHGPGSP
jgi:hypothetical protein